MSGCRVPVALSLGWQCLTLSASGCLSRQPTGPHDLVASLMWLALPRICVTWLILSVRACASDLGTLLTSSLACMDLHLLFLRIYHSRHKNGETPRQLHWGPRLSWENISSLLRRGLTSIRTVLVSHGVMGTGLLVFVIAMFSSPKSPRFYWMASPRLYVQTTMLCY